MRWSTILNRLVEPLVLPINTDAGGNGGCKNHREGRVPVVHHFFFCGFVEWASMQSTPRSSSRLLVRGDFARALVVCWDKPQGYTR